MQIGDIIVSKVIFMREISSRKQEFMVKVQ